MSLEKNPANGGRPAKASEPIHIAIQVYGRALANPPIFLISCSSDKACIIEPAPRNSSALKNACVIR